MEKQKVINGVLYNHSYYNLQDTGFNSLAAFQKHYLGNKKQVRHIGFIRRKTDDGFVDISKNTMIYTHITKEQ